LVKRGLAEAGLHRGSGCGQAFPEHGADGCDKNSRFGTAKQIFGLRSQVFTRGFHYLKRPTAAHEPDRTTPHQPE
jgi:hypothetical protein